MPTKRKQQQAAYNEKFESNTIEWRCKCGKQAAFFRGDAFRWYSRGGRLCECGQTMTITDKQH